MFMTLISIVAAVVLLYGLKLIGDKNKLGFYVAAAAEVLWIFWGVCTESWALTGLSAVLLAMYVRNVWAWSAKVEDQVVADITADVPKVIVNEVNKL